MFDKKNVSSVDDQERAMWGEVEKHLRTFSGRTIPRGTHISQCYVVQLLQMNSENPFNRDRVDQTDGHCLWHQTQGYPSCFVCGRQFEEGETVIGFCLTDGSFAFHREQICADKQACVARKEEARRANGEYDARRRLDVLGALKKLWKK